MCVFLSLCLSLCLRLSQFKCIYMSVCKYNHMYICLCVNQIICTRIYTYTPTLWQAQNKTKKGEAMSHYSIWYSMHCLTVDCNAFFYYRYCTTSPGSLDWFEVEFRACPSSLLWVICLLPIFIISYALLADSSRLFWTPCTAFPARWEYVLLNSRLQCTVCVA